MTAESAIECWYRHRAPTGCNVVDEASGATIGSVTSTLGAAVAGKRNMAPCHPPDRRQANLAASELNTLAWYAPSSAEASILRYPDGPDQGQGAAQARARWAPARTLA